MRPDGKPSPDESRTCRRITSPQWPVTRVVPHNELRHVALDLGVELAAESMTPQIGQTLWRHLDASPGGGTPADFEERHLVRTAESVAVWSRRGIVMAHKESAGSQASAHEQLFVEFCQLAAEMRGLLEDMSGSQLAPRQAAARTDQLLQHLAGLQFRLTAPEHVLLRRFTEASNLDGLLETLRDLNLAALLAVGRKWYPYVETSRRTDAHPSAVSQDELGRPLGSLVDKAVLRT